MKLTADILLNVYGSLNALQDRECSLRDMGITAIENLAVLQDQFDHIDFTNNDIIKLENLPRMKRLSSVFLVNNSISRISKGLGTMVPHLKVLDLTGNQLRYLSEVRNIGDFKELEHLSLCGNPVVNKPNYRRFMLYCIPSLKFLDFRRITAQEREDVKQIFQGNKGKEVMKAVDEEAKAVTEGQSVNDGQPQVELTAEQKVKVRAAISAATSKIELDRIELQVQTGTFPFDDWNVPSGAETGADVGLPAGAASGPASDTGSEKVINSNGTALEEPIRNALEHSEDSSGGEKAGRTRSASTTSIQTKEEVPEAFEGDASKIGDKKRSRPKRGSSVELQQSEYIEKDVSNDKSRTRRKRTNSVSSESAVPATGNEQAPPTRKRKKSEDSTAVANDGTEKKIEAKKKSKKK